MQQNRFSVLTGHLNDYPLPDLVGILRHQQKTGRLSIEYPKGPALLFFKDGELVDAQFEQLSGLQAICVAFAQPASSFNFNPLIKPYRRSIDSSLQKAVSEFLGCWDESAIDAETPMHEVRAKASPGAALPPLYPLPVSERYTAQLPESRTLLALPPGPSRSRFSGPVMVMAAAGLLMLGVSAFISVNRGVVTSASPFTPAALTTPPAVAVNENVKQEKNEKPARSADIRHERESNRSGARESVTAREKTVNDKTGSQSQSVADATVPDKTADSKEAGGAAVSVVLKVENGRVTQASIGNPKRGMEAYEALALRIARQRRFPAAASGQQTVVIKVD